MWRPFFRVVLLGALLLCRARFYHGASLFRAGFLFPRLLQVAHWQSGFLKVAAPSSHESDFRVPRPSVSAHVAFRPPQSAPAVYFPKKPFMFVILNPQSNPSLSLFQKPPCNPNPSPTPHSLSLPLNPPFSPPPPLSARRLGASTGPSIARARKPRKLGSVESQRWRHWEL